MRKTLCLVKHNLAQQIFSFRFIHVCNFSFISGHKQNCAHEGYQLSLTKVLFQDFALTQLLMKLSEDYQQVKKDLLFPQQIVDHLKIIHLKLYFHPSPVVFVVSSSSMILVSYLFPGSRAGISVQMLSFMTCTAIITNTTSWSAFYLWQRPERM